MTEHNFIVDKRFTCRVQRSPRVVEVAEAFGIGIDDKNFVIYDNLSVTVRDGDVVYITGQSGAGKSLLLKELDQRFRDMGKTVVNLVEIEFDDRPLIDQIGADTNEAIRLLTLCGLTDAVLWVRRPHELSDGERYRLRLAKAIETKAEVWVADEFCAVLDRSTAKIVAFALQKAARMYGATLIVATTHKDLAADLGPDLLIEKRFQEKIHVACNRADTDRQP